MNRKLALFALVAGISVFSGARAADLVCSGTVEQISYHANNTFMLRLSSMNVPVFFCSPDATHTVAGTSYTTGPETCKAMIALLITARESGRTITGMYFDGAAVPAACNAWTNWASANIRNFSY